MTRKTRGEVEASDCEGNGNGNGEGDGDSKDDGDGDGEDDGEDDGDNANANGSGNENGDGENHHYCGNVDEQAGPSTLRLPPFNVYLVGLKFPSAQFHPIPSPLDSNSR